ncbi:hypothetical protein EZJ43_05535 [Pedobacter changchengzhani]|uniref:Uncharacterized protein n=1 Tax=Pedobacter changchengzhani TaxID=2529274 RepID=A0A4R5MM59_9SPHI|nr:hypothetical protein [Pedobacter changchengzhani]TDG36748.1 hypothetical protein EZJ43_05535 [Pedobacter changchengzhani]
MSGLDLKKNIIKSEETTVQLKLLISCLTNWKNSNTATQLLNEGLQQIGENPTTEDLHTIIIDRINLLVNEEKPSGNDSVLVG